MTDDPRHLDDTQAFEDDELDDEELEDEDLEEEAPRRAAPTPPARRTGRGPAPSGMGGPRRGGAVATRATKSRGFAVDPSLRIRDRVSALFVIATLIVFGVIFANALAFGHGGAFSTHPTPQPTVNLSPGPSASGGAGASPAASPSAVPSTEPSPTAAPSSSP